MDEGLKAFLEKFAELERRVRKLAANDRSLQDEVRELKLKLAASAEREQALSAELDSERDLRKSALGKVDSLIENLEILRDGGARPDDSAEEARVGH